MKKRTNIKTNLTLISQKMDDLKQYSGDKDKTIREIEILLEQQESLVKQKETELANKQQEIENKQKEIQQKIDEINQKNQVIDEKNAEINTKEQELQQALRDVQEIEKVDGGDGEMKDKEWLIQKVSDIFWRVEIDGNFNIQNANIMFDDISNLIDELNEPKKPVIPQFVADYIEKYKDDGLPIQGWFSFKTGERDVEGWIYANDSFEESKKREWLLIDAIRHGYEIEKEKRYYIVEKINNSTLMTFELSDVVGGEIIEFVDGYSENETIHFDSKEKAELIAHFVGESLEVEEVTE